MRGYIYSECQDCGETENASKEELAYDGGETLTSICSGCESELCYDCFRLHDCGYHKPEGYYCMGCGKVFEWDERIAIVSNDGDTYCTPCQLEWEAKQQ